jgi:RNA polymerase sigma factor (sigma-70 family)
MENEYIREILDGNLSRFSYFVSEYKDMAYSIAFRIVGSREEAEEVVQDSYIRAFKSLNKFRQASKFSTWFYRIVVNNALSHKRKIDRSTVDPDIDRIYNIQPSMMETEYNKLTADDRIRFINQALDLMAKEDSLLLTLFYLNENSIEEITEITSISGDNVKMKLSRARKKMYVILERFLKSELKSLI